MRLQKHQLKALRDHEQSGRPIQEFIMPPPLPRKKRNREESEMQCALIKWWSLKCREFGIPEIMLFSIPNGGGRSGPVLGSILKAEGLRKGAPDLMLAVPKKQERGVQGGIVNFILPPIFRYAGLFLELKRPNGVVSPEQIVFYQRLSQQGYQVAVCRSLNECINQITAYLS